MKNEDLRLKNEEYKAKILSRKWQDFRFGGEGGIRPPAGVPSRTEREKSASICSAARSPAELWQAVALR